MLPFLKRKARVLVLDDDVSMQKLVSMLLRREGLRVEVVSSGRAAIESLSTGDYGAVLLDVMMPTEGGMTVIKYLREQQPELLKKTIMMTATTDAVLKNISGDVFAVVKKPFQPADLVATVKRLV